MGASFPSSRFYGERLGEGRGGLPAPVLPTARPLTSSGTKAFR
jgi:hypothetical protein